MPLPDGSRQPIGRMGAGWRTPPRPPGYYAGYGIDRRPAPPASIQHPIEALEACIRAGQEVLGETVQTSDLVPWITPPYRSRMRCEHVRAVLNVPAVLNAAANAAGLALAAAQSAIVPITVLTPTIAPAFTDAQALWTLTPSRSHDVKIVSWGITVENAPDEALEVLAEGGTAGGLSTPPNPFISSHQVELQQPADTIVTENKTVTISVRNRTQALVGATPLLIHFGVCYYEYVVDRFTDGKSKSGLRGGFGTSCL